MNFHSHSCGPNFSHIDSIWRFIKENNAVVNSSTLCAYSGAKPREKDNEQKNDYSVL